jgi:methyltransferase (TIGR00027 family)
MEHMRSGRPSQTAQHNALFRALEASLPPSARLFEDALAGACLTWPLASLRPVMRLPGGSPALRRLIDRRWPGVRTSVVARTRLIDDTLNALDDDQLGQLVILGAGFDTRPYRLERLRSVPIFEVDHPDTQAAKQAVLQRALPAIPDNVSFVPTDFNLGTLAETITVSGYRSDQPTVFLWEGVTNYLTEHAVDATLRWCAQAARPGSLLIFTYVHSDVLERPESFVGGRRLQTTLEKVGEQLTFGMDPDTMNTYLAGRGLDRQWDFGAADYRARYFGDRAGGMVGHEFYRAALARVRAPKEPQSSDMSVTSARQT